MDRLRERLEVLIDRIGELLEGLTPRDRALLLGLIGVAVVALTGGVVWWMNRSLDEQGRRLADRAEMLQTVQQLSATYAADQQTAQEIEEKIRAFEGTDLPAFMEQAASRAELSDHLDGVKGKPPSTDGALEDTPYTVSLSNLSTEDLASFLYEIETAGYPLKVRTTTVRVRTRAGEKVLSVDLDVSAFRLLEVEG